MMQSALKKWSHQFVQDKNSFYFTLALLVVAASFGSWKGYGWYVERREQSAQLALSEALDEYYRALDAALVGTQTQEVTEQIVDDARIAFESVLSRHKGSYLLPYAQALDADIAWYAGNKDQAVALMQKAMNDASLPVVRNTFRTKYALMLLDHDKTQEGLELLRTLALDKSNSVADYAAYYLGYYYWVQGDEASAREAWQVLETFQSDSRPEGRSPWLEAAQAKLSLLS